MVQFSSTMIPGPLVDFFKSLCIAEEPKLHSTIVPVLPQVHYAHPSGLLWVEHALRLPAMPPIHRALQHLRSSRNWNLNFNTGSATNAASGSSPQTIHSWAHRLPGVSVCFKPPTDAPKLKIMLERVTQYDAAYPDNPTEDWSSYLGWDILANDIHQLQRVWVAFCGYFQGNVPLNEIAMKGNLAGQSVCLCCPQDWEELRYTDVRATCSDDIEIESGRAALLLLLNVHFLPGSFGLTEELPAVTGKRWSSSLADNTAAILAPLLNTDVLSGWFWDQPRMFVAQYTHLLNQLKVWVSRQYSERGH